MYAPHVVTIYNAYESENLDLAYNITVIKGVLMDESRGTNIAKSGLSDADTVTLFIPFSAKAVDGVAGVERTYLPPKAFYSSTSKDEHWTLDTGGQSSGVASFFVKGRVVDSGSYSSLRSRYDAVYNVSSVDIRDFGTPDMQHFQVGGK